MEILLDNINDIENKFKELEMYDWLKIINIPLNIGIVITRKIDRTFFPMIYNDVGTIFFDKNDKAPFYEGYDGTDFNLEDLKYYLELLIAQTDIVHLKYIILLMAKSLKINDTIVFESGKRSKVVLPKKNKCSNIQYKLIKINGELGKKELTLYGEVNFTKDK